MAGQNERNDKQEHFDHDGLWKDLVERFWRELLQLCIPDLYADADLSREPEFLDKELRAIISMPGEDEHNFARFVDELMKIYLKNGDEQWILLHIEIQGPGGEDISIRMVSYCCLIYCHRHIEPVALAILTSPRPKEKLGTYEASRYGTHHIYCYNYFELYNQDDDALLRSDNPLELALYAAKKAVLCRNEEMQKLKYLRELTRLLNKKGWSEKDRRDILIFIARFINLKDRKFQLQYIKDVQEMKGEGNMAEATFIENYFRDEGIKSMAVGMAHEGIPTNVIARVAKKDVHIVERWISEGSKA